MHQGDDPIPKDYQLKSRLGFKLSRLSRMMQARLETSLTQHGLTRLKWCVLSGVAMEGHQTPSDLADHIGITRPAISRVLKQMIHEGIIERVPPQTDGRSRQVRVTPLGQAKLTACWPLVQDNQRYFLEKLAPTDQEALQRLLQLLIAGEHDQFDDI